ncbi:HAD family hydrolase [Herminiimonas glaciei]|uniref:phosphoglycolate phosphatase n=1 Tax=Herminiimonas glaciei TaxID=523788 RepID=A0ABW2IC38_9BURK
MKKLLVTDVDNTLLDWQALWFETFSAMARRALDISGIDPDRFYAECSIVHQKHGTSEYAFLLTELPCLIELYGANLLSAMQPAIDEYRVVRRKHLKLYPQVLETLRELKQSGIVIAAFTESKAFYTNYRFRKLDLDGVIDVLYSPPDHEIPFNSEEIRRYDSATYQLKFTDHRLTPEGELKPNPHILSSIIEELGFTKAETAYVGDNLLKDIHMAQEAGVMDIHAKYGAAQHKAEQYDLLKKVTHWTTEMVDREQSALSPGAIKPTYTLHSSFSEIISILKDEKT